MDFCVINVYIIEFIFFDWNVVFMECVKICILNYGVKMMKKKFLFGCLS